MQCTTNLTSDSFEPRVLYVNFSASKALYSRAFFRIRAKLHVMILHIFKHKCDLLCIQRIFSVGIRNWNTIQFESIFSIGEVKIVTLKKPRIVKYSSAIDNSDASETVGENCSSVNISLIFHDLAITDCDVTLTWNIYGTTISCKTIREYRIRYNYLNI